MTLVVRLPSGYPDISPDINLRNPRGLDEATVKLMQSDAEAKCKDFIGQPVMFELIEVRDLTGVPLSLSIPWKFEKNVI